MLKDLARTRRFGFSVVRPHRQGQTLVSIESFTFVNKLFHPKASKITITFKNEPDRKSKSELPGFGFGYKFVLY